MMNSTTIMNQIRRNERFAKVQRAHEILSAKYGDVVVAGGCLVDCFFDKDFYDIDCFITVDGLKDEFKKEYTAKGHLKDVLRDEIDGEAIDIVVVDYSIAEHVNRFDQNFKKIYYDGKLHIRKSAVRDLNNNEITVGTFNGTAIFFRCIKSALKYNMKINEEDLFLMYNFLCSQPENFKLPKKYEEYRHYFESAPVFSQYLASKVAKISRQYWRPQYKHCTTFSVLKKQLRAKGIM